MYFNDEFLPHRMQEDLLKGTQPIAWVRICDLSQGSHQYLADGIPTPLKTMKVNWDDEIPNIWKSKRCSKPPSRS